jgi:hypothetical protein
MPEGNVMSRGEPSGCVVWPFVMLYLVLCLVWWALLFVTVVPAMLLYWSVRRLVRGPDLQFDAAGVRYRRGDAVQSIGWGEIGRVALDVKGAHEYSPSIDLLLVGDDGALSVRLWETGRREGRWAAGRGPSQALMSELARRGMWSEPARLRAVETFLAREDCELVCWERAAAPDRRCTPASPGS